jgi:CHAT domain-containing protein/pimeloyl-ACP methyl ester carboxylesterase
MVLELAGGLTVFTSPEKLKETLARVAPQAIGEDGSINLDMLRERGAATRSVVGDAVSGLVARVTKLDVGAVSDEIIGSAKKKALEWLGEKSKEKLAEYAELGVSWIGTKALMWAVESRLTREPGLYRWVAAEGEPTDLISVGDKRLAEEAQQGPLLVFVHGTASSTAGSYADLQTASRDYWRQFETRFGERIYAFEHRTMSESPIENALQLARVIPDGARLNLVTHSRGGLVGDLLCLSKLDGADQALVAQYAVDEAALGETEGLERERLRNELKRAYAEQREHLLELAAVLSKKKFIIERYVRVACPARGTRLASGNFDVFLSGLLSLIGLVPALAGSPLYSAFKRVVLEIAKNRTKPNLVPGIEAMLPESPMGRLLARATPQDATKMAVISGDIKGGGLLKRLGVLFTDNVFFDGQDNDLVVDTDSMYAGVARPGAARALFDQGPDVNHFRYFTNDDTRIALRSWLLDPNVDGIEAFAPLAGVRAELSAREEQERDAARGRSRGGEAASLPVVVVLPGIMGSHLWVNRKDRVWFDFADLATGGLEKIGFDKPGIEAEKLFGMFYGDLCDHLAATHRIERFAYDWRQSLDVIADALAVRLRKALDDTKSPSRPVRVLAHSMGGLVVRALIHKHRPLWDELMGREGARLVMLGTPNQGSFQMVEMLIGKGDTVRNLGRLDLKHDLQDVLDIIGGFPGALQLLPRPGFKESNVESNPHDSYFEEGLWPKLQAEMRDFWFGDKVAATPRQAVLDAGRWLWDRDNNDPTLPSEHESKVFYVHGCAASTPCGIKKEGDRWKMLGTPRGDGSVTWDSGAIKGIDKDKRFYMPAEHGALADTEEYFESLESLLARGECGKLMTQPPRARDVEAAKPLPYEAGPPAYPTELELASGLIGRKPRVRARERVLPTLKVRVHAMDLRESRMPILVGHYEQDAISGAEALIDRELVDGGLTQRYDMGLYAGPLGTATIVLPVRNESEHWRGSNLGAVVAGLGKYDGSLSAGSLAEAVRTAALRYLLHIVDAGDIDAYAAADGGVQLSSLLIGYNSSANLTINDAVTAIVRGVVEANRKFAQAGKPSDGRRQALRIGELEIVELYIDTAISAAYALQRVAKTLNADPALGCRIEAEAQLREGEGMRMRLDDEHAESYWPRIVVTDADRREDECPPECYEDPCEDEGINKGDQPKPDDPALNLLPVPSRRLPAWMKRNKAYAERLRFMYLGQRARAETTVQQSQPGLVESLVAQQLHVRSYQSDFSRTLFQLLVPHEFKDAARQLDRVVMVLDGYTANLPWELMLADEKPLAVKMAIVRQFSSTRFRAQVRQAVERRAYVIGNPSYKGYAAVFPKAGKEPDSLPAAENEALTVVEVLAQYGYDMAMAIGQEQKAMDVITRLYKNPYRVLHIAAHGVFEEKHIDGSARSGVVLSDGLLITAAEIGAMEIVPELVFLNCCHLGKVNKAPTAYNRLAYSVARELIEIGVRAVVVAGWAVDDDAASLFAETFYRGLLEDRKKFGDSIFDARKTVWERFPTSITWGAYQAYGDPGWRLEPQRDDYGGGSPAASAKWKPVAPEELIARIEQARMKAGRIEHAPTRAEAREIVHEIDGLLQQITDKKWLKRLDVCAALGRAYGDLGKEYFSKAAAYYLDAIKDSDKKGRAPISAIEQLANLEARDGEANDKPELIVRAIARLHELVRLASEAAAEAQQPEPGKAGGERAALLGSAYKRLAVVHARRYLDPKADAQSKADVVRAMEEALKESERWYRGRIKEDIKEELKAREVNPYNGLNWLFLAVLNPAPQKTEDWKAFAQRCAAAAAAQFDKDPSFWNAIMVPDAFLVESLLDGSLADGQESADRIEKIAGKYQAAKAGILVKAKDLDSTVQQMCFMALFYDVRARAVATAATTAGKAADSLRKIAERISPGVCKAVYHDVEVAGPNASVPGAGGGPLKAGRQSSAKLAEPQQGKKARSTPRKK